MSKNDKSKLMISLDSVDRLKWSTELGKGLQSLLWRSLTNKWYKQLTLLSPSTAIFQISIVVDNTVV